MVVNMGKYRNRDSYSRLYDVLTDVEERSRTITASDLCRATEYKLGTVGAYIRNKLKNVHRLDRGTASSLSDSLKAMI